MADIAIAHYVRFRLREGGYVPARSYQNFFVGETRTYSGADYQFAPFLLHGGSSNRTADQGQASLLMEPNEISVNLMTEAVGSNWLVEANTVYITADEGVAFTEEGLIASELWSCSGYRQERGLSLILSAPLDAARAQAPTRALSSRLVGSLPATGQIFSQ